MLTRFSAVLARYEHEIGRNQLWRYKTGHVPRIVRFIVDRPDLADALAEDARRLEAERTSPPCVH